VLLISFLALLPRSAFSAQNSPLPIAPPAGFVRLEIHSPSSVLLSLPFEPASPAIQDIFANQLHGAATETYADRLITWNPETQRYIISFKADQTGDQAKDKRWFYSGDDWTVSTQTLAVGQGFWLQNRNGTKEIFLSGRVVLDNTRSISIISGLNLFGYPFSSLKSLNNSTLATDGSHGGTTPESADRIHIDGETAWLLDAPTDPDNGKWMNSTGGISGHTLEYGKGYWYHRVVSEAMTWTESRPYTDPFATEPASPRITSISPTPNLEAVALDIIGPTGQPLEILYKDILPATPLATQTGWKTAASSLLTDETGFLRWEDFGGTDRLPVTGVTCRIYLVALQNADADSDGISDAREIFILGTDPNSPSDPGDDEAATFDTPLPWSEDFEPLLAGSISGQNDWILLSGSANVQTSTVYEGAQALQLLSQGYTGQTAVAHDFSAVGETNVWVGSWIRTDGIELPDISTLTNQSAAIVSVNSSNQICAFDGVSSTWLAATNGPTVTGQWVHVTIALDYQTRQWKLYSGGSLLISNIGFKNTSVTQLSRTAWTAAPRHDNFLDDIAIDLSEPTSLDDDNDGIPNSWELANSLDPSDPSDASEDPDNDGLSNLQEYLYGSDPSDPDTDDDNMLDGMEVRWGCDPATSNAYAATPWQTGFEPAEGYSEGALHAQDDWIVNSGAANVQTSSVAAGLQAAEMLSESNSPPIIEHFYAGATGVVLWSDMKVRLPAGPLPDMTGTNAAFQSAVISLGPDRRLACYDGSSQAWLTLSNFPAITADAWLALTAKQNYQTALWTFYRDGIPLLKDLGFADPSVDRFNRAAFEGSASLSTFLDDLTISTNTPPHIDDDIDGIPNVQEDINQNGIVDPGETDPFNNDTDGDGMDDGQELDWGYDPTASNTFSRLPWSAGFEPVEGYALGPLDSQQLWTASTGASVTADQAFEGGNSAGIHGNTNTLEKMVQYYGAADESFVWVDMYAKLRPGNMPAFEDINPSNSVVISVNSSGVLMAYDSGQGQWISSGFKTSSDQWTRLTFGIDYAAKVWSLNIDAERILENIPFANKNTRWLSRARISIPKNPDNGSTQYIDRISAAIQEPAFLDDDGDGIPNYWENQHGLDPSDPSDAPLDYDGDGLTNLQEYQHGTDPNNSDTDGDGVSDLDEIQTTFTDPTTNSFTSITSSFITYGAEFMFPLGEWTIDGTDAYAADRRGYVDYIVNAPSNDMYRLTLTGTENDYYNLKGWFKLLFYVDGEYIGKYYLHAPWGVDGEVSFITPWLTEGPHTIGVYWDNVYTLTSLRIKTLSLDTINGPDSNGNGVKDWVENALANQCSLDIPDAASIVSPACIEGDDRYLSFMSLSDGTTPKHGAGHRWYADVPLSEFTPTNVAVSFQNGGIVLTNTIEWTIVNVLDSPDLMIRKGDSLRLTALPGGASSGTVTIDIDGNPEYTSSWDVAIIHTFDTAGAFSVNGSHDNGTVTANSISVEVVECPTPESPAVWRGRSRLWPWFSLPDSAVIESDPSLHVTQAGTLPGGRMFSLTLDDAEKSDYYMVARLGSDGPILANLKADGFWLRSGIGGYIRHIDTYPDGTKLLAQHIVTWNFPETATLEARLFVGGVTFDDGTIKKNLSLSDFDETGQHTLYLLQSPSSYTAPCHRMKVYQNGALVGTR